MGYGDLVIQGVEFHMAAAYKTITEFYFGNHLIFALLTGSSSHEAGNNPFSSEAQWSKMCISLSRFWILNFLSLYVKSGITGYW